MNQISFYIVLAAVNFVTLTFVAGLMFLFLRRKSLLEERAAEKLLKKEENKLQSVLNELAHISTVVYTDVDKKKTELRRILDEAQDKIDVLEGLIDEKVEKRKTITSKTKRASKATKKKAENVIDNKSVGFVHRQVYELADRGLSILEIAKTLSKHKGEVELILNLRDSVGSEA